jgi:hypothetical protein
MSHSKACSPGTRRRGRLANLIREATKPAESREPLPTFSSLSEFVRNMYEEVSHNCAPCRSELRSDSSPR